MRIVILAFLLTFWFPSQAFAVPLAFSQECVCEQAYRRTIDEVWHGKEIDPGVLNILDCEDFRILRNTIFARHGYAFTDESVKSQFAANPCYRPDPEMTGEKISEVLTFFDLANVGHIQQAEAQHMCADYWASLEQAKAQAANTAPGLAQFEVKVMSPTTIEVTAGGVTATVSASPAIATDVPADGPIADAIPNARSLIARAMAGEAVESAWLTSLACVELTTVRRAVYARHNYFFEESDRNFFGSLSVQYKPNPDVNDKTIDSLLKSRDQLTILRVDRALREAGCDCKK